MRPLDSVDLACRMRPIEVAFTDFLLRFRRVDLDLNTSILGVVERVG